MSQPKISVVIPMRNEAGKIEQCLKVVFSQSLKPHEMIVVDGYSNDKTIEKAKQFPVKIFYEDYHNRAGGCQIGVENAEGEYIAFTGADCIPDKDWLANLVKEFDEGGVDGRYEDIGKGLWTRSVNLTFKTSLSGAKSRWNRRKVTKILLDKTDAVCVHALATLLHYVVALDEGAAPVKLGLSKNKEHAYMQCVNPGQPYTEGGTVIFRCRRIEQESID